MAPSVANAVKAHAIAFCRQSQNLIRRRFQSRPSTSQYFDNGSVWG
jgi:hypothetical protein